MWYLYFYIIVMWFLYSRSRWSSNIVSRMSWEQQQKMLFSVKKYRMFKVDGKCRWMTKALNHIVWGIWNWPMIVYVWLVEVLRKRREKTTNMLWKTLLYLILLTSYNICLYFVNNKNPRTSNISINLKKARNLKAV